MEDKESYEITIILDQEDTFDQFNSEIIIEESDSEESVREHNIVDLICDEEPQMLNSKSPFNDRMNTEEVNRVERKDLGLHKEDASEHFVKGVSLLDEGKYKEAIVSLKQAIEVNQNNAAAYSKLGMAFEGIRKNRDAIENYKKAITLNKDDQVSCDRMMKCIENAGKTPPNSKSYYAMGETLYGQGNYKEAIECFDKVIKLKPQHASAFNYKGCALLHVGRAEEAFECFKKSIEIKPKDASVYFNLGNSLDDAGRYQEALEYYKKTVDLKPKDAAAYYNMGISLSKLGNYKDAILSYKRAIELKPDDSISYFNMGDSLYCLGKYQEAIENYNKSLLFEPNDADAYYSKGDSLYCLGKFQDAICCFNEAINLRNDYSSAHNYVGCCHYKLGEYQQAIESFCKGIDLEKNDWMYYCNRGKTYKVLGLDILSLADFEQAGSLMNKEEKMDEAVKSMLYEVMNFKELFKVLDEKAKEFKEVVLQESYKSFKDQLIRLLTSLYSMSYDRDENKLEDFNRILKTYWQLHKERSALQKLAETNKIKADFLSKLLKENKKTANELYHYFKNRKYSVFFKEESFDEIVVENYERRIEIEPETEPESEQYKEEIHSQMQIEKIEVSKKEETVPEDPNLIIQKLVDSGNLTLKDLKQRLLVAQKLTPGQICLLETDLEILLDDIKEHGPDNVRIKVTLEILARKIKLYKAQSLKIE